MKRLLLLALACLSSTATAAVIYDEASGDLSGTTTPTPIGTLALGDNTVVGVLNNTAGFDRDVFTFTVAAGQLLSAISVDSMTGTNHFLALDDGSTLDSVTDASVLLGSLLIGSPEVGTDILDDLAGGTGFGSPGFVAPLAAGDYTFWFQETNGTDVDYSFTLSTTAVPEPGVGVLGLLALVALAARRGR